MPEAKKTYSQDEFFYPTVGRGWLKNLPAKREQKALAVSGNFD
jgi:hypothetical protein